MARGRFNTAFNPDLDEILTGPEIIDTGASTLLEISVVSYNSREPKVQIRRFVLRDDDTDPRFRKLGRLSFDELREIAKAGERLIQEYEKQGR